MHHAQGLLQRSTDGVAQIAARVGYTAEPAFSRAFKRFFGIAPSEFRRNALAVVSGLDQQTQE
jgi:transcriptional regulator GlxA family with amidase domain